MAGVIHVIRGNLRIRISGLGSERFLNLCAVREISLWSISFREGCFEASISLRDFRKLRPLVRKTKIKVAVLKKNGLPFLLPGIRKQWSFLTGAILAILFWFVSSFFLWEIRCYGNVQVTRDQLLTFLEEQEVSLGKALSGLNYPYLEKELRRKFPQIIWTSMKQDGTRLIIEVKENELENTDNDTQTQKNSIEEDSSGRDMVSAHDGIIESMIVRKGVPKVKIGDKVTIGQVLVEGIVPVFAEDGTVKEQILVDADADILIRHSLTWEEGFPLEYTEKWYSGRERYDYYVQIGGHMCTFELGGRFYRETMTQTDNCPQMLQKLGIPVNYGKRCRREYLMIRRKMSGEEQKKEISEKIKQFISTLDEKGVQIIEKNVKIENGSKYIKLHGEFMVLEKSEIPGERDHNDGI